MRAGCLVVLCAVLACLLAAGPARADTWSAPQRVETPMTGASVSCATATFCAAVDTGAGVRTFDGRAWSAPRTLIPYADEAVGACGSPASCVVIGYDDNRVATFDGRTWRRGYSVRRDLWVAVSCPAGGLCLAVTQDGWSTTYRAAASATGSTGV
jgi:hypothetical protein